MKHKLICASLAAALFAFPAFALAKQRPARRTAHAAPPARQEIGPREGEATATRAQTLPIRRVILYSNGVAHIERRGTVTGHAEVALSFKQSQVDDVLKSMVVLDLGQGRIGAVSYNSSAPPAARMADIPFSVPSQTDGGGGLAGILAQLQGARVVVTTKQGASATGAILTVEERQMSRPDGDDKPTPATRHALVITSETGELMSFDLSDVRSVRLADEGTRRDVREFARATASARRRDAKTIVVTSDGAGAREMVVSYTIAAPIWKTTYRTVFDSTGKPFFQGWAIVDNVSEEDWLDVQLSLISGTPISFIQPIQQPFYRYRPVVPMPADLKLHPQTHDPLLAGGYGSPGTVGGVVTDPNGAAVANASVIVRNNSTGQTFTAQTSHTGEFQTSQLPPGSYTVTVNAPGFTQTNVTNVAVGADSPTNIGVNLRVGSVSETVTVTGRDAQRSIASRQLRNLPLNGRGGGRGERANNFTGLAMVSPGAAPPAAEANLSDAISSGQSGVEAAAEGGEVGDLFEYQIQQPVTVRRDRSALIPIVQTRMEGARVSIFNESVRRDRPMSGLLLKNTSGLTLEDGALTVIDGNAYAGEALMERLKPQEQRLVSFALDLGTLVGVQQKADRAPASVVRIKDGVFQVHYFQEDKKIYAITNQTDRPRVVYVEHPVRQGWELTKATAAPEGRSNRYYRFRVELQPNGRAELPVTERRALMESYALADFTRPQLDLFFSRRYIDEQTRAALQKLIDLKTRIGELDARDSAIDEEIEEIGEDQKRLRENIQALNSTAEARQLISRYVQKADQQETRIEQLTKEKQSLAQERAHLQAQLNAAVRALVLDRNLTE
ncbi:MAG TPA: carboxypeptidase regulatory-like domain-containing protein [Pyrinomonadaceae bacterium]|nr:carboxypeptidase regulatory-like domain-containing protein [Pyrinomonadaceae bacterium]